MPLNITTVKTTNRRGTLLTTNMPTSDPFTSDADTDYEQKKAAEKKAIHKEILRVAVQTSSI